MGHNGGCHADEGDPLASPAHALAVVLETDGVVEAELVLITTSTDVPTHIDGATVSVTESAAQLARVAPGTYAATPPDLTYAPAQPFTFVFEIDPANARAHHVFAGAFEITVHGGAEVPVAWVADVGDAKEVSWSPAGQRVLIDVFDATGARTHATLDWDDAAIEADTWRHFPEGGTHTLDPDAFGGVAPHRIRVCAVEVFRRDGEPKTTPQHALDGHGPTSGIGWLSGGVAGRCVSLGID